MSRRERENLGTKIVRRDADILMQMSGFGRNEGVSYRQFDPPETTTYGRGATSTPHVIASEDREGERGDLSRCAAVRIGDCFAASCGGDSQ